MTSNFTAIVTLSFLSLYSYFVYPVVLVAARALRIGRKPAGGIAARTPLPAAVSAASAVIAPSDDRVDAGSPAPFDPIYRPMIDPTKNFEPKVSLIVTAHNEEERIRPKLDNCMALQYPSGRLEIIVASDASTDATETIAASYPGVTIARVAVRKGKEHAQKQGILASTGEILVFTDVATLLDPDVLRRLVRNFQDPEVGALSSTDKMIGAEGSGEGMYVRYEMLLRRLESGVRGLVGLSGSFFAARRTVCMRWAEDLPSDFNTVLNCVRQGYRAVSDDAVIGYYRDIRSGQSEFQRKVRTLVRGITAFFANLELLDFRRFGFFSFQLFSHKLMRWLAPFFMILLVPVAVAGALAYTMSGAIVAVLQGVFYGLAFLGYKSPAFRNNRIVRIPFFFTQSNFAILAAWFKYLRGERISMWTPSKR